jgi:hypothetical protein
MLPVLEQENFKCKYPANQIYPKNTMTMVSGFSVQVSGINRLLVAGSSLLASSQ